MVLLLSSTFLCSRIIKVVGSFCNDHNLSLGGNKSFTFLLLFE